MSTWLTENESENFSAPYVPAWMARDSVIPGELFCTRCRLLPGIPVLLSIPAALVFRLEDTNVAEEAAVRLMSMDTHTKIRQSYMLRAERCLVPR